MMRRCFQAGFLLLCTLAYFGLGYVLVRQMPNFAVAEALALLLVLPAARLLPGPGVLWLELLGAAATLPVLWHTLPPEIFFDPAQLPLSVLYGIVYLLLTLLGSTLGPMLVFLLAGDWL